MGRRSRVKLTATRDLVGLGVGATARTMVRAMRDSIGIAKKNTHGTGAMAAGRLSQDCRAHEQGKHRKKREEKEEGISECVTWCG